MKKLVAATLSLLVAGVATAADYRSVADGSSLAFRGTYDGEPFDGRFKTFTATVSYDAANVAATTIGADIDVASVDTQNAERDETLAGAEFFDFGKYPKARFTANACSGTPPKLSCQGELTIRDKTQKLPFPVTLTENADGSAKLDASVTIKRSAFDVGTGDWADTDSIADDVQVDVSVKLAKQ